MKILILKSFGIGNVTMMTPMIRELHEAGHTVSLLYDAGPLGGPTGGLLAGWRKIYSMRGFDRTKEKDGGAAILSWIKEGKFDLVIQSFPADSLYDWIMPHLDMPIRRPLSISSGWTQHEVDYNFDLVRDLIKENPSHLYELPSHEKFWPTYKMPVTENFVVVCPAFKKEGLWWKKHWGDENYAELIKELVKKYTVVLLDGKDGIETCNRINYLAGGVAHNFAGQFSINESAAVIEKAGLVIANDSGPAHMAAAYNRDLMVFFGPTSDVKNQPIGPKTFILKTNLNCSPCQGKALWTKCLDPICIKTITPAGVLGAIQKYIVES